MGGVGKLRRRSVAFSVLLLAGVLLSGCKTLDGPDRMYSLADEVAAARYTVETLTAQYYGSVGGATENVRNEIISRRMYISDVEYSQYEQALTRERQEVGFVTSTTAQGLNVAGALFTPAQTVRILSGLAGGVGAVRGYYDSEVVIAKTIQIAQGQMRFLRDKVSDKIRTAMAQPLSKYPLSLAMTDVEEYYRAGTLAAGLIKAVGDSGSAADVAAAEKVNVINVSFGPDANSQILWDFMTAPGANGPERRKQLNRILRNPPIGSSKRVDEIVDSSSAEAAALRDALVRGARSTIPNFPR